MLLIITELPPDLMVRVRPQVAKASWRKVVMPMLLRLRRIRLWLVVGGLIVMALASLEEPTRDIFESVGGRVHRAFPQVLVTH